VLAFLTCLVTLRATDLGRAGWVASALHIPSGH
jgi:hypothetical protein